MNVKEYISSGIVEAYVLGLASSEDRATFERMCQEYPEVLEARQAFELSLENHALANAVQPPSHIKSEIFSAIKEKSIPGTSDSASPVVPLGWRRYIAAASIVLLAASTLLNYYFFTRYKEYSAKYDELVQQQSQVASANQTLQAKLENYKSALSMIKDPVMAVVKMPSVPKSPNPASLLTLYWNTKTKDVYLLVNNLPQPGADKQYQLWALVDGKPVDAGVFDIQEGTSFVKMKNIPQAQAFAVTLEKRGGSPTPTLDAMYVYGKVS